jgi:hypothetical protein
MADRILGAGVAPVGRGACVGKKPAASSEKGSDTVTASSWGEKSMRAKMVGGDARVR